eukprot:2346829-Rhodomonas_salina.1
MSGTDRAYGGRGVLREGMALRVYGPQYGMWGTDVGSGTAVCGVQVWGTEVGYGGIRFQCS